ncbi:MAG: hypothetical protein ACR650_02740 [Methylocystis sp.]|jgi:hypothetical protein
MSFKHSAFVALFAIPAICGFGSTAFAEDVKWGAPKVAGQPGYQEPPKKEEVHAPRPVQPDARYVRHQSNHPGDSK